MLVLLPALYLGWGIGANDTANAFGPQIGAQVIAFRQGVVLTAAFAFVGAVVEGQKIFPTLGGLTRLTLEMSIVATVAAGLAVNVMTKLGLPISTSHSIVGALVGVGVFERAGFDIPIVLKVATSMATAPVGAACSAYILYRLLALAVGGRIGGGLLFQRGVRYAAVAIGCYAAYAMGANNVGNAMAPYVAVGVVEPVVAAVLGGAAMATGALTYSRNVIMLVGRQITALDPLSALVATLATALTVHLFTQLGIPVSTSQAVVGAVVGVGLTKGMMAVNVRMWWMIPSGWVTSVVGAGGVAYGLLAGYRLFQ
jgi:PiT family inorganic phosphate transporter